MTLATRPTPIAITSIDELARVSDMFAKSGLFQDARDAAQAGVKIMAGQSWGIDPFNAMSGIFIIKGRPTVSAGLMAAAVKGHPKYDYRVRERSDTRCAIEFYQGSESLGISEYTIEMAKRAGLTGNDTWRKHPEAMLFARAMSSGVRTFVPDVFTSSVYTPEELGAHVDDEGMIIALPDNAVTTIAAPTIEHETPTVEVQVKPNEIKPALTAEPVVNIAPTDKQLKALTIAVRQRALNAETARVFFSWLYNRPIASSKELTRAEVSRVLGWTDEQWEQALLDHVNQLNLEMVQ
jgi:hypothetical protein